MTAPVVTLNCTVGEIEELLANGTGVEQIARDLQEPRQNVVAVWDRWRKNNGVTPEPVPATRHVVAPVRMVPSTPTLTLPGHRVDEARITVDALAAAAGRSTSKRTQALGVRLADLARVVRDRLAEERAAAEHAEAEKAQREAARAEVERLEAQLRTARAKLAGRRNRSSRGPSPVVSVSSDRRAAATAKARAAAYGEFPCSKGCGKVCTTAAGRGSHERSCGGSA